MPDSSSKLIFQGSLSLLYCPKSNSKSSDYATPTKKKKSVLNSTSSYSVLYLDGRLECYPGDPFSVGSLHEACRPVFILHFNPFNHWSLISIPAKSSLPYPFTVSRKLPPVPSVRSYTNLTHLGLDVETMGTPLAPAESKKSKDRKSLKQRIGFGSKYVANKTNSEQTCTQSSPPTCEDISILNLPPLPQSSSFMSKLGSPSSSASLRSSLNPINLPDSITFSTQSENIRKQWIDAFIEVFRSVSDLKLTPSNFLSILKESQSHSPTSLSTPRSVNSDSCLHSHSNLINPSCHTSRIPLAPLSSQCALPLPKSTPETTSELLDRSVSQTTSLVDLYNLKLGAGSTLPSVSSHVVTVTPAGSPRKKQPLSDTPSLTEHIPASSSPSDYCLSPPPLSSSTSLSINANSPVKLAEAVPAWIKAVRNADDKRLEQDGAFQQPGINPQVSSEIDASSKLQSPFEITSRESSLDQGHSRQVSQGPSSFFMSQSFSAPGPISTTADLSSRHGQESSKAYPSSSMKFFGTSVVQNLKRAGSLTDWSDFSNAGQSILQRMRENDNQSVLSDSPTPCSPVATQDPIEGNDLNLARNKRAWLLHMVKKNGSVEKTKGGLNSYPSVSLLASTSATRPPSRAARHGVYMLKGLSSNSSLASSSHQIVTSSRESDGQHSLHQVLTPGTDSDQGHRTHYSDQTLPQLPNKLSQSSQKFPNGQSKQAFSEWLTTTSAQAALRLAQPRKNEFDPTHTKSRSLASLPWSNLPSQSSSGSPGFSLSKSNAKLNNALELGLNILNPDSGLSRSVNHERLSSETSSSSGQEYFPPNGIISSPPPILERSQSPPSRSPENIVRGPKELDQVINMVKLSDFHALDNERLSYFSTAEYGNKESFQGRENQRIVFDQDFIQPAHAHQKLINSRTSSTEKNVVINQDSSSKENSFQFLSSEPPESSNWFNPGKLNKVTTRGRTHTIGTLQGGSYKGYDVNHGTSPIPSLPVPPARRKSNKSSSHTTVVTNQVRKDNHHIFSADNHAPEYIHCPLKESRLKFNSSGDQKNQSKMKIDRYKNTTTGIEGDFGK